MSLRWYDELKNEAKERKNTEDVLSTSEMCDVCGKAYHYKDIHRVSYKSSGGTLYRLRCCRN